jgi:hypothetical protein
MAVAEKVLGGKGKFMSLGLTFGTSDGMSDVQVNTSAAPDSI